MHSILRDSRFSSDSQGHGGNRRTCQIDELVNSAGFSLCDLEQLQPKRLKRYFYGMYFFLRYFPSLPLSLYNISASGRKYYKYIKTLRKYTGKQLILWEDNINYVTPYLAKDRGFKVIALPHNLESFVITNPLASPLHVKVQSEIQHLSKADAIFCISREEQWLLGLWGVKADYLPYYPPSSILKELLEIREARDTVSKSTYLILGTALNSPTLSGMMEQIEWILNIQKNSETQIPVVVAGYGTEKLRDLFNGCKITILGSIESDRLYELLVQAKAILVHQKAGAGALTRMPEMLIAGIPVISNAVAARSALHYSGVYHYDDQDGLSSLLNQEFASPAILERPLAAEQRFISYLKKLA